jgi:hypothetical protein
MAMRTFQLRNHENQVFDRDHRDQRPEDQREHEPDIAPRKRQRAGASQRLAKVMERTGTNVAEHHAEGCETQRGQAHGHSGL